MDGWNIFESGEEPGIEHKLGEPQAEEKLCSCKDPISSHDRHGCMRRGCDCKITLATLTFKESNDRRTS